MKFETTADPEFSALVPPKPKPNPRELSARLVRPILHAHGVAALLSASQGVAYVAGVHGLIGPKVYLQFEAVSMPACLTAFVFPALIGWAVTSPGVGRWEGASAVVATVGLSLFQLLAALPGFQ